MKVNQVGSNRPLSGPRRKREAPGMGGEFARQLQEVADAADGGAVMDAGAISPLAGILAAQEVPDSTEGRSRGLARQYGEEILDGLDRLRVQLLDGAVSREQLANLAQTLRARRQRTDDPRLDAVLEEIELRAEVELAKLDRGR